MSFAESRKASDMYGESELRGILHNEPLDRLIADTVRLRDLGHSQIVSYSRTVLLDRSDGI